MKNKHMRRINPQIPLALCATSLVLVSCSSEGKKKTLPNIVFILADDLGYGDLSCYGQQRFSTPNIDRLASQGMLFRQHYAGCTVSAPSRSCLMTGLHTGHTPIRGNKEWDPEGQWPLPASSITMAEMLKSCGYTTGAFGKWALGYIGTEGDPNSQGFDEFFGYNCQRLSHNYYPGHLWHNQEKIILHNNDSGKTGTYGPDIIHKAALDFIKTNRNKPFFLYYPSIIPHAELYAKEEYMGKFRGKFNPEKVFNGTDSGPGYRTGAYGSQPESHAAFAALITQLDDQVGEIMALLNELGLEKNTVVVFTSDNGPHLEGGADPDYFNSNGELRGYKRDLYEGGIRVPLIVRWPDRIKAGSVSDHVSAFWDFMPTFAELTGSEIQGSDGISLLPSLTDKKQPEHSFLYWEFHEQGGKMAVRMGNWKAVRFISDTSDNGRIELYDLSEDKGEENDVSESNPEIVKEIIDIIQREHKPSDAFPLPFEL